MVHCNALYICKLSSSQDLVVGLVLTQTLCVLNFSFYMHAFKIINVLYFVLFNSDMKETGLKELRRAMESSLMQMEMFSR